ncbi:nicotinate (nicotinamide) nucleotide adenylyltransferase [candidate division WOR-1 bacterium RIFOXYD2_FULL_36_8]|uniref:Probable nicotinate-nucleotide adenylyltransferase n=1 Tax=candidate division WOR-1 bacterium RIFOXYB2_FULL_36_35 TaxID=1802578 RepID=A0A1F4S5L1_UNCSA|nr:MAG: nicotinate (nicotinamide) nucleotide adenylyltransferase [candidate division WOR-1 bacterium RIFOXYA2_FULL_36_21]OGC15721.1 MAG: nicotinate (nicotinamide) nucleotide adenylyltransferase [candidate division WOR-1 bacterium RIFOXYB2_FULL_36_35]OGC21076.1 MAG: nicotinate (nicotinamide) nucleotide adenylyltransferase [candidate division WOR-1 bacterium RIFOXYA12_FULL_36_13]OGC41256.1 MAG: nicotinate (nicotinamide) nucleotide adenylyltransferase [candidate division WOR-1 bacterium RIFOXYD2_FU
MLYTTNVGRQKKIKRLGIMGGTFDPIHKGHIALAKAAKREFILDGIVFMPSGNPPHKDISKVTDKEDRYQMVQITIKKYKSFFLSRLEMDRQGVCYAVDTFNELKRKYGSNTKLFYIMGMDSILEILDWKKPLELFTLCEFIVGTRQGAKIRTFKRLLKFPPLQKEIDKIHLMELKEDISSSNIRSKLKTGKSVARLVPRNVLKYIREKELYN